MPHNLCESVRYKGHKYFPGAIDNRLNELVGVYIVVHNLYSLINLDVDRWFPSSYSTLYSMTE